LSHEATADGAAAPITERRPLVECRQVSKFYGGVHALRKVSLRLFAGEVTCLVGDNGAGKSTLVGVLTGMAPFEAGEIVIDETRVTALSPQIAQGHGIQAVYQQLALCETLGAAENVMLGQEPIKFRLGGLRFIDRRTERQEAARCISAIGVTLADPTAPVSRLSGGQRQAVAIARATVRGHRLIILDEPTAALGVRQTQATLELVRRVADRGTAVLMISHNLDDVFAVADRIVVLRLGAVKLDKAAPETSREEVVGSMTGVPLQTLAE
jgi:ABC-type sugar transport system ATPase subunit